MDILLVVQDRIQGSKMEENSVCVWEDTLKKQL